MTETVHVVEPAARTLSGHYFHFIAPAARYLGQRGFRTVLHVSAGADISRFAANAPGAEIRGTFTYRESPLFETARAGLTVAVDPWLRRIIRNEVRPRIDRLPIWFGGRDPTAVENLAYRLNVRARGLGQRFATTQAEKAVRTVVIADFSRLLASDEFKKGRNHLFIAGSDYLPLSALLEMIERAACDTLASLHIRLWSLKGIDLEGADLRPVLIRLARSAEARGLKLFWYCEAPWGVSYLRRLLKAPVGYLDLNAFRSDGMALGDAQPDPADGTEPFIFFPGEFRRFPDKGIGFIADLADIVARQRRFRLRMQEIGRNTQGAHRQRLLASGVMDFLPTTLDSPAYAAELRNSVAVVLPYDWVSWTDPYRSSGVFLEGILLGKPILVRRGTPLSQYSSSYDFGQFRSPIEVEEMVARLIGGENRFDTVGNRRRYLDMLARNDLLRNLSNLCSRRA